MYYPFQSPHANPFFPSVLLTPSVVRLRTGNSPPRILRRTLRAGCGRRLSPLPSAHGVGGRESSLLRHIASMSGPVSRSIVSDVIHVGGAARSRSQCLLLQPCRVGVGRLLKAIAHTKTRSQKRGGCCTQIDQHSIPACQRVTCTAWNEHCSNEGSVERISFRICNCIVERGY